ncbi:MAG: Rpn family recombination-promoting nuclease/putative transposase [Lachnospiraceae bacterium]|nr:Rpn family recombination-promoting nuclease/putative transposase [Lachnospiraceae bacterium]
MKRKTLKDLTLKDNFMFGAVMSMEDNCRRFLEMVLSFPIERLEISKEKCIIYHPEYKGVRLDIYAKDENHTHYNVEMQAVNVYALGKRTRYYHSQIDMELLLSGADYAELPQTFVIFICDFDPFGEAKYCYTFERRCIESPSIQMGDGCTSIFLSTQGQNPQDVSASLVKFLDYVRADLSESQKDFEDDYVEILQQSVRDIKESRGMEERFMQWELLLRDERVAGRAEGRALAIIELLEELGQVSESLKSRVMEESDISVLTGWLKLAAKCESVESFMQNM